MVFILTAVAIVAIAITGLMVGVLWILCDRAPTVPPCHDSDGNFICNNCPVNCERKLPPHVP